MGPPGEDFGPRGMPPDFRGPRPDLMMGGPRPFGVRPMGPENGHFPPNQMNPNFHPQLPEQKPKKKKKKKKKSARVVEAKFPTQKKEPIKTEYVKII